MSSSSSSDDSDEDIILQILINLPRPRRFRDRSNPLQDYDDLDFKCRFRLSKETFMILLHMIGDSIKHKTNRSSSLSPVLQLLIALRYYATGAFQMVLGDHIQVNKSTVCRVIKTVSTEIARLRPQFIEFPSTVVEQQRVQLGFFRLHQFPRVIGALDCSHTRIQSY
ncbi:unnamed protein product [Macrosiphum euphorbiae]|uniref:Nuclease HARBI1 n=1 Tax=Macrosiphum euphorbiae TaxID=13131 RepID=A0AAV0WUQ1_9HEMI|nr:unnamed protein product [Macrosiphum euphorbiae]